MSSREMTGYRMMIMYHIKTPSSGSIYLVNGGNWNLDYVLFWPGKCYQWNDGPEWFGYFVDKEARLTDDNQMARGD